jgi:hypothetical protein
VKPALKQRAFAVNFATQNMALGIGAVVAAVVVRAHDPATFQLLFVANALSCLLFAVVLLGLPTVDGITMSRRDLAAFDHDQGA